jgi:hypothetical protein
MKVIHGQMGDVGEDRGRQVLVQMFLNEAKDATNPVEIILSRVGFHRGRSTPAVVRIRDSMKNARGSFLTGCALLLRPKSIGRQETEAEAVTFGVRGHLRQRGTPEGRV